MTAILIFWIMYKAIKGENSSSDWYNKNTPQILLALLFAAIVDWVCIYNLLKILIER